MYLEKSTAADHTVENLFLLLQLYLKSIFTQNFSMSYEVEQDFYRLIQIFRTYTSLSNIILILRNPFIISRVSFTLSVFSQWNSWRTIPASYFRENKKIFA
ncbi:hypothetical protein RF11_08199 [Thelohanellus kitauei]|uniref:Uncharacterized protein n=1 Tax=Thelohanellus kitauei TaxID=669202 RepID=A0A0C2JWJ7_THEKT|nr:hypothetical protein RF11_08199 [Thelohanellus kitauei]